jgi:hypothetical protein
MMIALFKDYSLFGATGDEMTRCYLKHQAKKTIKKYLKLFYRLKKEAIKIREESRGV